MSQGKRKRSSSLPNSSSPSSGKVEVDESLETGRDSNPSEFCYACGTNLKKNKLRRNVLNHSHNPPQSGKYPVLIDEPAVSDSAYVLVVTGMSLTPSPKATLSPKAQMSHNQGTLLEIIQSEHGVLELLFPLPFSPP